MRLNAKFAEKRFTHFFTYVKMISYSIHYIMRNGNTPLGAVLQSEAGAVRACRKIPMGILPQHSLRRRGAIGLSLRGRNSRLRDPRVKGFECARHMSVYVLACAAIFVVCRVAVCGLLVLSPCEKEW